MLIYLHKKRPPEKTPISGEPPVGYGEVQELLKHLLTSEQKCDHSYKQIIQFFLEKDLPISKILGWLSANKISCACSFVEKFNETISTKFENRIE